MNAVDAFPPASIHAWRANAGEQLAIDIYDREVRGARAVADLDRARLGRELLRQERERAAVEAWSRRLDRLSKGIVLAAAPLLLLAIAAALIHR